MSTIRIAPLVRENLEEVGRIDQASQSCPWSPAAFVREVEDPQGPFLVLLKNGQVAGFAGAWMVLDEAHINTVAIDPIHRRQGYGIKLIQHLLAECHKLGATCATLEVRAGNEAAITLYERLGFVQAGRRKDYYPDNNEDGLVMWCYDMAPFKP